MSITWTSSSSAPLRGANSFLLTKDATNNQGRGVSFDFSIDSADKTKVIRGYFDYAIASGTYADDDVTVWIYDVTNATLIQPAPYKLMNHSLSSDRMNFEFQASTSTSYRLILHIGSTSASAYTLKCDNFVVGPIEKVYGSPITDWIAYTPTGTLSTNVSYTGKWRRIGDSIELEGTIAFSGANTQGVVNVLLPNSLQIDTTKLTALATARAVLGSARIYDASTDQSYDATVILDSASGGVRFSRGDTTVGSITDSSTNRPITFAASDTISFHALAPVVGWSSSQIMSSDADTRVVSAKMTSIDAVAIASLTDVKITMTNSEYDTHGMVDLINDRFNILVPGTYEFKGSLEMDSVASTAGDFLRIYARVGGTTKYIMGSQGYSSGVTSYRSTSGSTIISGLVAGNYVEFVARQGYAASNTTVAGNIIFTATRISGPAQIAASETIAARYTSTAGAAVPDADNTIIDFATKDYDYTGMVTTGASFKATAPVSGLYEINVNCLSNSNSTASNIVGRIRKNGTAIKSTVSTRESAAASYISLVIGTRIRLLAGEYVDFIAFESTNINTWDTGTGSMSFEILRVGNY